MLGGTFIALLRGLDPKGADRATETLQMLADRQTLSPAERHVFQLMASNVIASEEPPQPAVRRPQLEVIAGGAA